MNELEEFYLKHGEPLKGVYLSMREMVMSHSPHIKNLWRYGMPFFYYKGMMLCYLWFHKKYQLPYIGFMDGNVMTHPALLSEKRSRAKILLLYPNQNLPVETIKELLKEAMEILDENKRKPWKKH